MKVYLRLTVTLWRDWYRTQFRRLPSSDSKKFYRKKKRRNEPFVSQSKTRRRSRITFGKALKTRINLVPRAFSHCVISYPDLGLRSCKKKRKKEPSLFSISQFNNRNRRKIYLSFNVIQKKNSWNQTKKEDKICALAGNRTRVNCLEGSYAHHYTTNAHISERANFNLKTILTSRSIGRVGNRVRNYGVCMRI